MEGNIRTEHVNYHHPLLRYKIWGLTFDSLPVPVWNYWHHHKEIELLLVIEGTVQVETTDRLYELSGPDVLLLGSSKLHRTRRIGYVEQIVLQFDMLAQLDAYTKDYAPVLLELSEPLDRLNDVIGADESLKSAMYRLIIHIYEEASGKKPGFDVAISGAFKQLLSLMIRYTPTPPRLSHSDWQRLRPVLDYVDAEFQHPIHIQDILPLVHLEYHYFIKYFQQCIGMSFVSYLHLRRIKHAEHLLLTRTDSIADVGARSGFPNVTQFIRIFKRHNGCTPATFRRVRLQLPEESAGEQ